MDRINAGFSLANAQAAVGKVIGTSDWVFIDQVQVNVFGEVSRWHNAGHCDPVAARSGPFGGTLVHGFHMLSLLSYFVENVGLRPVDGAHSLNYGLDKARVLQPVLIGDGVRVRSRVSLLDAVEKGRGEMLLKTGHEMEADNADGTVLYAEYLNYWYPKAPQ